jgi:hypothetical protein
MGTPKMRFHRIVRSTALAAEVRKALSLPEPAAVA